MRYLRLAVIIIFIGALGVYGASRVKEWRERDSHVPTISSDRNVLDVSCSATEEELMEGLTAQDEEDGDLTSGIMIGSRSHFTEPGVCTITYVVFDSASQSATFERETHFTDYRPPQFSLSEPLVFTAESGDSTGIHVGASDMLDGDLSNDVKITDSTVNYQTPGAYTVTVEVSNSYGDVSSAVLPVHVLESWQNELDIQLTAGIVYLKTGEGLDAGSYVAGLTDGEGNALDPGLVQAQPAVDASTPGIYEVQYIAADSQGRQGNTWLTVIVEE